MLQLSPFTLSSSLYQLQSSEHKSVNSVAARVSRGCIAVARSEASRPERNILLTSANAKVWRYSNRAVPSLAWRCGASQNENQESEPDGFSTNSLEQSGVQETAELQIMKSEFQERKIQSPSYDRLALVEDKDEYIGRAIRAGKGAAIADVLQIFNNLLERPYGGGVPVANAGGAVIERVTNDVQELRGQEGVSDQVLFELLKVVKFLEMDMELVRAAQKEETLMQRLEAAQVHCKQAIAIANSF